MDARARAWHRAWCPYAGRCFASGQRRGTHPGRVRPPLPLRHLFQHRTGSVWAGKYRCSVRHFVEHRPDAVPGPLGQANGILPPADPLLRVRLTACRRRLGPLGRSLQHLTRVADGTGGESGKHLCDPTRPRIRTNTAGRPGRKGAESLNPLYEEHYVRHQHSEILLHIRLKKMQLQI